MALPEAHSKQRTHASAVPEPHAECASVNARVLFKLAEASFDRIAAQRWAQTIDSVEYMDREQGILAFPPSRFLSAPANLPVLEEDFVATTPVVATQNKEDDLNFGYSKRLAKLRTSIRTNALSGNDERRTDALCSSHERAADWIQRQGGNDVFVFATRGVLNLLHGGPLNSNVTPISVQARYFASGATMISLEGFRHDSSDFNEATYRGEQLEKLLARNAKIAASNRLKVGSAHPKVAALARVISERATAAEDEAAAEVAAFSPEYRGELDISVKLFYELEGLTCNIDGGRKLRVLICSETDALWVKNFGEFDPARMNTEPSESVPHADQIAEIKSVSAKSALSLDTAVRAWLQCVIVGAGKLVVATMQARNLSLIDKIEMHAPDQYLERIRDNYVSRLRNGVQTQTADIATIREHLATTLQSTLKWIACHVLAVEPTVEQKTKSVAALGFELGMPFTLTKRGIDPNDDEPAAQSTQGVVLQLCPAVRSAMVSSSTLRIGCLCVVCGAHGRRGNYYKECQHFSFQYAAEAVAGPGPGHPGARTITGGPAAGAPAEPYRAPHRR